LLASFSLYSEYICTYFCGFTVSRIYNSKYEIKIKELTENKRSRDRYFGSISSGIKSFDAGTFDNSCIKCALVKLLSLLK